MSVQKSYRTLFNLYVKSQNLGGTFAHPFYNKFELIEEHPFL